MGNNKLEQESAFPEITYKYTVNGNYPELMHYPGMSKRFYAACVAMQGLLSNSVFMSYMAQEYSDNTDKEVVKNAYELADELLRQENL